MDLAGASIRGHCEEALARLNTPYIDLFIICRQDKNTQIEETMKALKELVTEGAYPESETICLRIA